MSYLIEVTIGDRTYHYGSEHAYREDEAIRAERIRSLQAFIIKEHGKIEAHRKEAEQGSEAANMQIAASHARIDYLKPLLEKERTQRNTIRETAAELNRKLYA